MLAELTHFRASLDSPAAHITTEPLLGQLPREPVRSAEELFQDMPVDRYLQDQYGRPGWKLFDSLTILAVGMRFDEGRMHYMPAKEGPELTVDEQWLIVAKDLGKRTVQMSLSLYGCGIRETNEDTPATPQTLNERLGHAYLSVLVPVTKLSGPPVPGQE